MQVSAAGEGWHTCARLANSTLKCWGNNNHGQLGTGNTIITPTPIAVSGIANATYVATGTVTSCAVLGASPWVQCWGDDSGGEIGDGGPSVNPRTTPIAVTGVGAASAVGVGINHACALLNNSTV